LFWFDFFSNHFDILLVLNFISDYFR
jgi:hypothetical protein